MFRADQFVEQDAGRPSGSSGSAPKNVFAGKNTQFNENVKGDISFNVSGD
jgi:hypothetical protein